MQKSFNMLYLGMPRLKTNRDGLPVRYKRILKLVEQGKTVDEIAEDPHVNMKRDWVARVVKKPAFIAATVKLHKTATDAARAIFEKNAVDAATKIVRISRTGKADARVQLDAAKEILYQIGLKPIEVIETRGREYTPEEIQSSLGVIKEVQAIEEKLSTQGSVFLVDTIKDATSSTLAPVNAGVATPTEELVAKE